MKRAKKPQGSASKISKAVDISSGAAVSSGAEVSSGDVVSSGAGVSSEAAVSSGVGVSSGAGVSSGTGVSDGLTNSNQETAASTSATSKPSRLPRRTQATNRSSNIDEQPTSSAPASNRRTRVCKKNQVPSQSPENEPQPTTSTATKTKNSRASKKVRVPDETLDNDQQSSTPTPATLPAAKRSRVLKKPQSTNDGQQPTGSLPTMNKKPRVSKKAQTSNATATKSNDADDVEIDRNVPCGSPDANCSICLSKVDNKSFTDRCFHMFCFSCLREWSQVNPVCPLCKQTFKRIYYNINDANEFDVYDLKTPQPAADRVVVLDLNRPPDSVEVRRDLYNLRRMVQEVRVPNNTQIRYRELTPEAFNSDDTRVRIAPWITREVSALLPSYLLPEETRVQFVQELINDLIRRVDIQSAEFYERISPYFGDRTYHFIHEFSQFARTNLDMSTYDQYAVYYPPTVSLLPTVLPTILPSVDLHFSISPQPPVQRMQPDESYYIDSDVEIVNTSEPAPPPPPPPPEITDHAFFNLFPSFPNMFASIRSLAHLPSNSGFMLPGTSSGMPTLSPVSSLGMFHSASTLPPTLNAVNASLIYDDQPLDLTGYNRQALARSRSPICLSSDSSANEGESSSTSCARSRMQKFRRQRRKRPRAYSSSSSEIENSRPDKRRPSLEIVDLSETIVEPVGGTILDDTEDERTVTDRETKTSFKKHPTGHKKSSGSRALVENVIEQTTESSRSAVRDRSNSDDEVSNIRIVETMVSLSPAHRVVPTTTEIVVNECIEISSSAATGENKNDPKLSEEEVTKVSESGSSEQPHNSGTTELEYIQSLVEAYEDELNSIVENDLNIVDLRGVDTISVDSDDSVEFVDAFQNSGVKRSRNISIMSSTDSDLLEVSDCGDNSARKSESVGRAKKKRDSKRRKNTLSDMSRCIDLSSSDEEVLEIPKEDRDNRYKVISLFPKLTLAPVSNPNSETVDQPSKATNDSPRITENNTDEPEHKVELIGNSNIEELPGSSLHIKDDPVDNGQQDVAVSETFSGRNADNSDTIPHNAVCDVEPSTSATTNNFLRDIVSEPNQTTDYNLSSNTCQNVDAECNLNTDTNESATQCTRGVLLDNESDDSGDESSMSAVQSNNSGSVQDNEGEIRTSKVQGEASSSLHSDSLLQCTESLTLINEGLIQSHEGPIQVHEGPIQVHEGPIQVHGGPIQSHEGPIQVHEGAGSIQNNESYIQQGNEGPLLGNESPLHGNEGPLESNESPPQGNSDLNTSLRRPVMPDNICFIQSESTLERQLTSICENDRIVESSECPQSSLVLITHFDDPNTEQDGGSMAARSEDCNVMPDFPRDPSLVVEHVADTSCREDAVPVYTDDCKTEPDNSLSNSQNSLTSALVEVSNDDLPGTSRHLNKSSPDHPKKNCSLKQNSTLQSGSNYNHAVACSSELQDTRLNNDAIHSYDLARYSSEHTSAIVKNGCLTSCTSLQTPKLNSRDVDTNVTEEADKNNAEPKFLENSSEIIRTVTDNDGSLCSDVLSSESVVDTTRLETAVVSS